LRAAVVCPSPCRAFSYRVRHRNRPTQVTRPEIRLHEVLEMIISEPKWLGCVLASMRLHERVMLIVSAAVLAFGVSPVTVRAQPVRCANPILFTPRARTGGAARQGGPAVAP
jgi:hypothetical protein